MEDKNRFVDQLLDSALANQRGAEPGAGFEGRILARVHAASEGSKPMRFWITSAATAAAVIMFVAIYVANRSHRPTVHTSQTAIAVPAPSPSEPLTANSEPAPKASAAKSVIEPNRMAHRQSKPSRQVEAHHWPSQFPTPAPLSNEQRALVRYVQDTPPQVLAEPILKAEFTVHSVEIEPLKITPLELPPLSLSSTEGEMQ